MIIWWVLIALGLALVAAAALRYPRARPGQRVPLIKTDRRDRSDIRTTIVLCAGVVLLAFSETQLQTHYIGAWAFLVLIPLTLAVIGPTWWHNRSVARNSSPPALNG